MKRVSFHPEAETEFSRAAEFYDVEGSGLGTEFADEVDQAVQFARVRPGAGSPVRGSFRRWRVRRFPYNIVYREEESRVYILAVAYHRRRPEYWRDRV